MSDHDRRKFILFYDHKFVIRLYSGNISHGGCSQFPMSEYNILETFKLFLQYNLYRDI